MLKNPPVDAVKMAIARGRLATPGGEAATSAEALTKAAVEALGGMKRFISRGDVVVVKPNIGWASLPQLGANTHPGVVGEVVRMCLDAGAKRVVVTDVSCNDYKICFSRSGIKEAALKADALVIEPSSPRRFKEMKMRDTEVLKRWPIFTPLVEADKVINVPVAKHHNLTKFTGAMKNWYGILGGTRNQLHQAIDLSIADLATFVRPTLTVVDATRVIIRNGPQGGSLRDVVPKGIVFATTDEVAADSFGASLLGLTPDALPYLALGEKRGLGVADYKKLAPKEVTVS
ncbi:MAG: DUF362 domain-containing protein [Deltaproteobacteria bacterium]|nr:DUF362 domain-containing protein [Deltaproteobacteria bacterium]